MIFSAGSAHGILSAEAGIAGVQMTKGVDHHCIGLHKQAQYLCYSYGGSDFHRHSLHSFVAMSSISRQRGKEKGYVYRTHARPPFRYVLRGACR